MSYSPYSKFAVGAAIETVDRKVFTGCNVENGSYGLCICAERVAIFKAVAAGHCKFRRMVIVAHPVSSPCGACRQVISEFFDDDAVIHAIDSEDFEKTACWTSSELLPDRFEFDK